MIRTHRKWAAQAVVAAGLAMAMLPAVASAREIEVSVRNIAPEQGVFLTPVFVGFHDGSFDMLNNGEDASSLIDSRAIETIAETGNTAPLIQEFEDSGAGTASGSLGASDGVSPPRIGPNNTAEMTFNLDAAASSSRYLSYGSMIIPSNDAFFANDDPQAIEVFDEAGNFVGGSFTILGSDVLDAGTEVNDEIRENVAFFEQPVGNIESGVEEDDVVRTHPGFHGSVALPDDEPVNILGGTTRPGVVIGETDGDFKTDGYEIAQISVQAVPEPASFALLGLGGLALLRRRRRRSA